MMCTALLFQEPLYHSEVMSIHGFYFELKAVGGRDGLYSFYLQVRKQKIMSCCEIFNKSKI